MVMNKVWEPLDKKDLPKGAKVVTSTWACKKKSNSTYSGQLNDRGFEQVPWKHFNPTSTYDTVMNDTTIRIVLVLMLLADWMARIHGINDAFLKRKFKDGKEIFMEMLQGMKFHY